MGWSCSLNQGCRTACTACLAKDWRKLFSLPPVAWPAGTCVQQQPKTSMWIEPGTKGNTKRWRKTSGHTKEPQHSKRQWVNYSDFSKGHSSCGVRHRLLTEGRKSSPAVNAPGLPCLSCSYCTHQPTMLTPKNPAPLPHPFLLKDRCERWRKPQTSNTNSVLISPRRGCRMYQGGL